jgi:hypothetical protein
MAMLGRPVRFAPPPASAEAIRRQVFDIPRTRVLRLGFAPRPPTSLVSRHFREVSAMASKAYLVMALIIILLGGTLSYLVR